VETICRGEGQDADAIATVEQFLIRGLDAACQLCVVGLPRSGSRRSAWPLPKSPEDSLNRRRRPGCRLEVRRASQAAIILGSTLRGERLAFIGNRSFQYPGFRSASFIQADSRFLLAPVPESCVQRTKARRAWCLLCLIFGAAAASVSGASAVPPGRKPPLNTDPLPPSW
jgi:hypothetical protein